MRIAAIHLESNAVKYTKDNFPCDSKITDSNEKKSKYLNLNNLQSAYYNKLSFKAREIRGSKTIAKVYTDEIDYKTLSQIKDLCNHPAFEDLPIRIMPDIQASGSTVVGFSAPVNENKLIPAVIGGDIGCGMLCVKVDTKTHGIDFEKLDRIARSYLSIKRQKTPLGIRKIVPESLERDLREMQKRISFVNADIDIGDLGVVGGGNHFIEMDVSKNGDTYMIIHSGSRKLGKKIADNHTYIAKHQNRYEIRNLSYLTGDKAREYRKDLETAEEYARINRRIIADEIIRRMGWRELTSFESVHNVISNDNIIRKGSISAHEGERLIIPLNMRDGVILARGKGNNDWNNTAPHGSGRSIPRKDAKESLELQEFEDSMNGIYSSCISDKTLDEAPLAYKDSQRIIEDIEPTADIQEIIRPIYNFKE